MGAGYRMVCLFVSLRGARENPNETGRQISRRTCDTSCSWSAEIEVMGSPYKFSQVLEIFDILSNVYLGTSVPEYSTIQVDGVTCAMAGLRTPDMIFGNPRVLTYKQPR